MTRKIIHCDCDCFYASVEMRDNPALRGRPVAVGGQPSQRGVIATCNYEARAFGVRSAMPSGQALKLCPDLLILPPAMDRYRAVSQQIFDIYREYTEKIEPLSLDEAYLDVSDSPHCQGSGTLIAQAIRTKVAQTVGVTVSAGVAPNKFLAKIASDWRKPDGLFAIRPEQVDGFVADLPVARLFGVGKVTAARIHALGVQTCGDLRSHSLADLCQQFGVFGQRLYELCRGIDRREVNTARERKSISVETTYVDDLRTLAQCEEALAPLVKQLEVRLQRAQRDEPVTIVKLFVKIRFADFSRTTAECGGDVIDTQACLRLLANAFARRRRPVRLLGVGVRLAELAPAHQMDLFGATDSTSCGMQVAAEMS